MAAAKLRRVRLSERQKNCLVIIGDHGLTGTFTEFARPETRRTVHSLFKKQLVQYSENRWILTRAGDVQWRLLVLEFARHGKDHGAGSA